MSGFNTISSGNNNNNGNNTGNNGLPPARNPLATAFEGFMRETPFVTRSVMLSLFATWCFQLVAIDPSDALANLPQYTIGHFQLYRILTSPLLCQSIFNLLFAFLSFVDHGKRLEQSLGSIQFAWLFLTFGTLSNLIHIVVSYLLYLILQDDEILMQSCGGIWIVLFGIIALECTNTHLAVGGTRPLFLWSVPTLYYPIVICALWSLLGGGGAFSRLPYFYSLGVGYAYAYGYLDRTRLSVTHCQQLEDASWLSEVTRREGWITGHAATGSSAWSQPPTMGSSFLPLTRTNQQQPQTQSSFPGTVFGRYGSSATTTSSDGFPSGGGRTLGRTNASESNATTTSSNSGPTQRRSHGAESTVRNTQAIREARLKALEKQQDQTQQETVAAAASMEESKETV